MESSKGDYRKWAVATCRFATGKKSISGIKLHRDLDIMSKSSRFMIQRLRESWRGVAGVGQTDGPAEAGGGACGQEGEQHACGQERRP